MSSDLLMAAALHEARHAGAFFSSGIRVSEVVARLDGSGHTKHASLDPFALPTLFKQDRKQAFDLVVGHAAAALAPGLAEPLERNTSDDGYVDEMLTLWRMVEPQYSAKAFRLITKAEARIWLCRNEDTVESFARQLVYRPYLFGEELQRRLVKTFTLPAARAGATRLAPVAADRPVSVWDFPAARQRRQPSDPMYPNHASSWRTGGMFAPATC